MAKSFITSNYDKFKDLTTLRCAYPLIIENKFNTVTTLRFRYLKSSSYGFLVLDVLRIGSNWMFLRSGDLIFNINNSENITLQPHENFSETLEYKLSNYSKSIQVRFLDGDDGVHCEESVYYEIPDALLKKLCDAQSVDIKISGDKTYVAWSLNPFILYCQKFYNAVYDNNAYVESVNKRIKGSGCMAVFGFIGAILAAVLLIISIIV